MICFNNEHQALTFLLETAKEDVSRLEVELANVKAELKFSLMAQEGLKELLTQASREKASLLEDLLIASGVKMSKQQEAFLAKEMNESEKEPSFSGQGRWWAQARTLDVLQELEKEKRSIDPKKLIEELEKEAGLA